ncbi:MAG TPA: hypothetical protein VHX38_25990 [Pseudonocardiaceae bacterium]|jgi:hypothetical protein|nr:hypothetical protein [Pseudonocardiaceae bacterium]
MSARSAQDDADPSRGPDAPSGAETQRSGDRSAARVPPRRRPAGDPFGDVLPDTTTDERDPESTGRDDEAWYRENRPPHHDQY